MTEAEVVPIDLADEERKLMVLALNEYAGTAQQTYRLLCPTLGQADKAEWYQLTTRLMEAIENKEPLSELDWTRALFLTEISFGSDLVGSGLDFGTAAEDYWIGVLRSLQYRLCQHVASLLLVQNATYPGVERSPTIAAELVSIELTDQERRLIFLSLNEIWRSGETCL
jgi:hypothetical protein